MQIEHVVSLGKRPLEAKAERAAKEAAPKDMHEDPILSEVAAPDAVFGIVFIDEFQSLKVLRDTPEGVAVLNVLMGRAADVKLKRGASPRTSMIFASSDPFVSNIQAECKCDAIDKVCSTCHLTSLLAVDLLQYSKIVVIGNLSKEHAKRVFDHHMAMLGKLTISLEFEQVWAAVGGNPFLIEDMVSDAASDSIQTVTFGKPFYVCWLYWCRTASVMQMASR